MCAQTRVRNALSYFIMYHVRNESVVPMLLVTISESFATPLSWLEKRWSEGGRRAPRK